jgi:hypothetical protein
MSYNFFVSKNSSDIELFNCKSLAEQNSLSEEDVSKIKEKFSNHKLIFIEKEENYDFVSNDSTANIVVIEDSTVDSYTSKNLKNVYLKVEDENNLFASVACLYPYIEESLDLKFKYFYDYNKDVLSEQLDYLKEFLLEMNKDGDLKLIHQITGFLNRKTKFDDFGEFSFFIAPDKYIYSHPMFYYAGDKKGRICLFEEYQDSEDFNQLIKPSLVCQACECFYCDRNIYWNKTETSEFKAPAKEECDKTTFLSKYSKSLFNEIFSSNILDPDLNLDIGDKKIEFEQMYSNLKDDKITTNKIKGLKLSYVKADHAKS